MVLLSIFIVISFTHTVGAESTKTITAVYDNFSDVSRFQLNGQASQQSNVLRLTPSSESIYGSAFLEKKIGIGEDSSFSTYFSFQISNTANDGADGFVFVIQPNSNDQGSVGRGIGYGNIDNSIGIEFDTWKNNEPDTLDISGSHVGIDKNGNVTSLNSTPLVGDLDLATTTTKHAWVDYNSSTSIIEVRVNTTSVRPSTPELVYDFGEQDLRDIIDGNETYIGFTSSTGWAYEQHDILSWYFSNEHDPIDVNEYSYTEAPTQVLMALNPGNYTTNCNVTATVRNSDGNTVSNWPVTFTATNATLTPSTGTTDSEGNVTVAFSYPGDDITTIQIKATSEGGAYEEYLLKTVNEAPSTPGEFISPTGTQIIKGGETLTARWGTSTDPENDAIKYDLWFFNGTWMKIGDMLSINTSSFTLPEDNTNDAVFRVYANDTISNSSAKDVTFSIDSNGPAYSWIEKVLNASTGENVTVLINVTDNAGVDWCNITVDGDEYQMNEESGNFSWNISIPASDSGTLVSSIAYNCTFGDTLGNLNNTGNEIINVSILPIADFSANMTRGTQPLGVAFTDNSSGLVASWLWNFGDGNTSTEQSPTNVFGEGNFTVSLTVENSNGTSTDYLNVRCAAEPTYILSPEDEETTSIYGDEANFSIESTLFASYEWFIDGNPINGSGVTLYNNTNDSSKLSYCLINSSEYINQTDFFMGIYNVSVNASNNTIGRTDTFSWEWTVTESSATDIEDIELMINKTPQITVVGSNKSVNFNTTNNEDEDSNGIPCSIIGASFNTTNNTDGIQIKLEVLNTSLMNESSINFLADSVYQYLDISFNNLTLANDGSNNRSIAFRVLNDKNGGTLIVSTVRLRHWDNPEWESYTPDLTGNDDTCSYFIVKNISGFSPFAITCDYQYSTSTPISSRDDGMSVYLKNLLFGDDSKDTETAVEYETIISSDSDETTIAEDADAVIEATEENMVLEGEDIEIPTDGDNKWKFFGIIFVLLVAALLGMFWKKINGREKL
ncbi:PGF-pre-PGF domain-containing protein [Methanolobus sp. ZRKC4]